MNSIQETYDINKILVSVIMLTYNRADLIKTSIKSVLEQSFENYELLIIDDGSTDSTESIINSIEDFRIRYFYKEHSGNISQLRNFGIDQSKGEYIAFIDSDDLWTKNKLENQVAILMKNSDVGFTFSDVEEFNSTHLLRKGLYHLLELNKDFYKGSVFSFLISNKMAIYPSSVLLRKKCLDAIGRFDELYMPGETNFLIRLAFNFNTYVSFEYWTRIRKHDGNISSRIQKESYMEMFETITLFYKTHNLDKQLYDKTLLDLQYGLAMDFWRKNQFELCRKELLGCFMKNPFFLKVWFRYFFSYLKSEQP